jgi:hypothetical protein
MNLIKLLVFTVIIACSFLFSFSSAQDDYSMDYPAENKVSNSAKSRLSGAGSSLMNKAPSSGTRARGDRRQKLKEKAKAKSKAKAKGAGKSAGRKARKGASKSKSRAKKLKKSRG